MPASLKYIHKANQVGINIGMRIFDGITHPGLGGKMHDAVKLFISKKFGTSITLLNAHFLKAKTTGEFRRLKLTQAAILKIYIVIVIDIVDADYIISTLRQVSAYR